MRRATIITVRTMIVLLLGAAAADLKVPGRSPDRHRVHLVDRSASTAVPGPAESLLPRDADRIVAHDAQRKSGGDVVTAASFARSTSFGSPNVDPSATNLEGALLAALGRSPTEIVLHTDGRADPGSALFLCRDRGVPVYVFPLGPTSVQDVRIVRVEAPPDALPGAPVPIAVTIESTFNAKIGVKVGAESREVTLAPQVTTRLAFTLPGPGEFRIDLEAKDACDENNHVAGEVFTRSTRRKVFVVSNGFPQVLPDVDLTIAPRIANLRPYDAVVIDNVPLPAGDLDELARWVRAGGGLVLLGGPQSYAAGSWQRTPLEDLSPVRVKPDLRIAAVFGIDSSGSMTEDFDVAAQAVLDARSVFDEDDDLKAMIFAREAKMLDFSELRKVTPTGDTAVLGGIETARKHLETRQAGRKVIVLLTDGITKETPEEIGAAIAKLQDIGLFVITTKEKLPGAAENFPIRNWNEVREKLRQVSAGMQDLFRASPGALELREHPVTKGVAAVALQTLNRTTPKRDAQVIAAAGRGAAQDPVLALGRAGQGRVAAFTIGYDARLSRLFQQAIDHVSGDAADVSLSIDPPIVRARGSGPPRFTVDSDAGPIVLDQVAQELWEGRLPDGLRGTVLLRKGRARAAATIPCPPEFEKLGVDRPALERIARETGGRVLSSPDDLETLPRPANPAPRSGRPFFLIAALALVFVELAVSTFWKV